ncbi:AGAP010956-PA, partial [Anopheles gambiae str. PEST]
ERNRFRALPNITIEDVRIESIQSFVEQALEIGTCFRRLLMMTRKNPYTLELIMEGFVFRAFCESVENFLCCYRVLVNSYAGESILQLLQMLSPANEQLLSMAKLCSLHPGNESDREFPTGSMLLDHLYRELIQVTQPSVSVFLLSTLRRCCLEYFAIFQRWLFQGQLHDPSGELFVFFVDHYRSNTKHFFDKAYFIRRKSVPGFLKGYDEDILLCGKYVMLLRAFRPLHPLFTLRHPELTVCLSFAEIQTMRTQWLRYVAKARQLCGPAVSVRELYETKQSEQVEFYRLVEENFRTYMDAWRVEQETEAQEQKRRKQKQMADLLDHLNEIRESKLLAKRAELQEELALEQARIEQENRQLLGENLELTGRVKNIVPVVTVTVDGTDGTVSEEAPFESCRESRASNVTSVSIYEDAQKSPACSVDSSPYGADSTSSYGSAGKGDLSTSGAEDLDCTLVEGPIVPTVESPAAVLDSDRLNSNVPAVSEGERNRAKVLGSTVGDFLNEDHANANVEQLVRRKNRERILISDYTSREEEAAPGGQPVPGRELSELQKNRRKIMSQEYNLLTDEAVWDGTGGRDPNQKRTMYLNLDSDRARNRRRILESEFDIATGVENFPASPMSVDSDTVDESASPSLAMTASGTTPTITGEQDVNANPVAGKGAGLKLDLTEEEDDEIYREFVAAMKQQSENFCRLAIPTSDSDTSAHVGASKALEKELNSVDVLTITRFLQYSLVIPLKAHMEIVHNEILKMYLYDLDVLGHFESLRNYFLLMDGEFSTHICDNLFQRLETVRTPEELLNYQTLHSILDGALYSSNAGTDRNADRLSFIVCQVPEKFDLYSPNVFSMLNLSYRVEWPLNLIFSNETIEQYTNVFKYLVKVRRVSYVLEDSFQLLKEASRRLGKPLLHSPQYARVQLIRHKLSHLVNALKNYITSSALHASWETFREDLQDATETMEDLFRKHRTYLKRVIFLCLLNRRSIEFYNNIEHIFRVVLRFYRHLRSKEWRLQEESQQYYVHPRYRSMLDDEIDFEKLIKYTIFLGNKMYDHGYQKEISEFLHVININGYYDDVKPAAS